MYCSSNNLVIFNLSILVYMIKLIPSLGIFFWALFVTVVLQGRALSLVLSTLVPN